MQMIDREPVPEDRQQLQREGYLLAPGLVNAAGVERLLRWTTELATGPEVSGRHWIYREDSLTTPGRRIVQRLENFCPFHEAFDGFVRAGALPAWTSALLGGPAVLFKDKINFKMPGGRGIQAAPGPAGRLEPLRAAVCHGHDQPGCGAGGQRLPGNRGRPPP